MSVPVERVKERLPAASSDTLVLLVGSVSKSPGLASLAPYVQASPRWMIRMEPAAQGDVCEASHPWNGQAGSTSRSKQWQTRLTGSPRPLGCLRTIP